MSKPDVGSTAPGLLILVSTGLALLCANTPLEAGYEAVTTSYRHWLNDGLMVFFFLLIGMEIKREVLVGALSNWRAAALPAAAALGGCLAPVGVFLLLTAGTSQSHAWGIPMATDVAFALGVLSLLGSKIPGSLKVVLAALAIVDDLCAVLVIALVYGEAVNWPMLGAAGVVFGGMLALARLRVVQLWPYVVLGTLLWLCLLPSGIHATLAGVLLAVALPTPGPLDDLPEKLQPWVAYAVVPLFCLGNAGIRLDWSASPWSHPLGIGILLGLLLGKPLGIVLSSWLAVRLRLGALPVGVSWLQMLGLGALGGIGFTMALFVTALALGEDPLGPVARSSILLGSLLSALVGGAILYFGSSARD